MTFGRTYVGHTDKDTTIRYTAQHEIGGETVSTENGSLKLEAHWTRKDNVVFRRVNYINEGEDSGKTVVYHVFKNPVDAIDFLKKDVNFGDKEDFVAELVRFANTEQV